MGAEEPADVVRVLIADDHPVFRDGLRTLLGSLRGFTVVGEAGTGRDAIALAESEQPDIVVMDLNMPEVDGIEATRQIVRQSPHIGVLVLTMFEDDDSLFAALRAGARGYVLKGATQEEMVRALEALSKGEAIFSPAVAKRFLAFFANGPLTDARTIFPELTSREREVLELIARGVGNQAIAERLGLRLKTVRNHVSNIYTKLQVTDRAQAIVRARESGLGGQR